MSISVSRLSIDDIGALSSIADGVFDDPLDRVSTERFLKDANHFLVAAREAGGRIVGMATGVCYFHPDKLAPEMFINEIGVTETMRRRGIGKAMIRALVEEAKSAGCGGAWLALEEDNAAARALYRAAGGGAPKKQLHIEFEF